MLVLAVITLAGLLLAVDPDEVVQAMKEVDLRLLVLAAALYLVNLSLKAARWRVIVTTTGTRLSYRQALRLFLCGLAVNNTTPGGVGGEPVRALLLRHETGTPAGEGLATIFGERLMDLTILMALSVSGLWFLLPELTPEDSHNMVLSLGLLVSLLAGLLVMALHPAPLAWLIARFDRPGLNPPQCAEKERSSDDDEADGDAPALDGDDTSDLASSPGIGDVRTEAEGGDEGDRGLRARLVGLMCQFQTGLGQIRSSPRTAATALGITVAIWLNASLRFGVLVLAVTGDVEAAGLIFLAAGVVYSVGQFLPLGAGNIAVATVVLAAAGVVEAQAAAVGLLEVATSLTLSVPLGMGAMALTSKSSGTSKEGSNPDGEGLSSDPE